MGESSGLRVNQDPLQSLVENIEILIGLNKKILQGLHSGVSLDSLDAFFSAKVKALQALSFAAESVSRNSNPDSQQRVTQAHAGQAQLARLEAQLAEALSAVHSKQKNVSAVTKAYSDVTVDKLGIKGVNIVS